jgi:predicted GNAT family N-acyltransferase
MPEYQVVDVEAADTHAIRYAVLRAGTPSSVVTFDGDDEAESVHLGVRDPDGALVAISTWIPRPYHGQPAVQLRGMATVPEVRGHGVGALLLRAGLQRAAEVAPIVWARARDTALDFYVHHGFVVDGDGFIDDTTQLPHHFIVRRF